MLSPATLLLSLSLPALTIAGKNPDVEACKGKAEGDACMRVVPTKTADGPLEEKRMPGVCGPDECCDLDYSKGSPPETVCGPCLVCRDGAGAAPPVAADGGGDGGGDDGSTPEPVASPADDGGSPPAANSESPKGCSVGMGAGGAPALAGLALWMLGAARRRRRT